MPPDILLAYFGHHKCGTQWVKRIVRGVCEHIGREMVVENDPRVGGASLAAAIANPGGTFLCHVNASRRHLDGLGPLLGFHVVRDPRDIVVSAYYSHRHSHPEGSGPGNWRGLSGLRRRLQAESMEQGLMLQMQRSAGQFQAMLGWDYDRDDVLEFRMEELTADAHDAVPRILSFMGIGEPEGLDSEKVAEIVDRNDFSVLAGRPPGTEDVRSHYRKGTPGDWIEHFTDEHIAYFKAHYNDLLLKLGYETSADWRRPAGRTQPRIGADAR